jgi:uncharacterized protein (TIGR03083 family)
MAVIGLGVLRAIGEDGAVEDYLIKLETAAQRFAELLAEGDLEAPVPSCPDWNLADLAEHLGGIHQWANHAVLAGNPDGEATPTPTDRAGLIEWYQVSAATLLTTLRTTDPAAPAWGFGPKPRTAAFWHRRQAHETAMHLWDAGASQALPIQIDPALAADGIDETVGVFFPRQVRLGRMPALERSLAVTVDVVDTADEGGRWVFAGDGTGAPSAPDAAAEATISGPAQTVWLLLWGRTGLNDPLLTISGDVTAAHAVLGRPLTP